MVESNFGQHVLNGMNVAKSYILSLINSNNTNTTSQDTKEIRFLNMDQYRNNLADVNKCNEKYPNDSKNFETEKSTNIFHQSIKINKTTTIKVHTTTIEVKIRNFHHKYYDGRHRHDGSLKNKIFNGFVPNDY